MEINQISKLIVDGAPRVHRELGPGLLESVYEIVRADLLKAEGLTVERQKPIPIRAFGKSSEEGFRADLIVNGLVLVELKSVEKLTSIHRKQVQTYFRLANPSVGYSSTSVASCSEEISRDLSLAKPRTCERARSTPNNPLPSCLRALHVKPR